MRLILLLLTLAALAACNNVRDRGGDYDTMTRGNVNYDISVPRAPDLESKRPVSDQDCTKPVNTGGNLRCR